MLIRRRESASSELRHAEARYGGLRLWVGLALAAGLVVLARVAGDLLGLMAIGSALAYLLVPIVDRFERRGLSRTAGAALVLLAVLLVVAGTGWVAVPRLIEQAAELRARWASGELIEMLTNAERAVARLLPGVEPGALGLAETAQEALQRESRPLVEYAPGVFEALGNAVLVPFVLFALLRDGPHLRRRLLSTVPNRYFEFAMNVAYKADDHLGGYLRGQALIALVVGAATAAGLALAGVPAYLVLGVLTGLANFVPYVGLVVSALAAIAVSVLTTGQVEQAISVLIVFAVVQTLENVVLQPWITGRNVAMAPVLVLFAILVGGRLGGIVAMALAVPVAAILKVLVVETVTNLRRYHL